MAFTEAKTRADLCPRTATALQSRLYRPGDRARPVAQGGARRLRAPRRSRRRLFLADRPLLLSRHSARRPGEGLERLSPPRVGALQRLAREPYWMRSIP